MGNGAILPWFCAYRNYPHATGTRPHFARATSYDSLHMVRVCTRWSGRCLHFDCPKSGSGVSWGNAWYSGTARDAQDTMEFSALTGVHPMIETYPLQRVADAYEPMHSGRARFRVVLTVDG